MYFKKFDNSDMRKFLIEKAKLRERNENSYIGYQHSYHETVNPDVDWDYCRDRHYSRYNLEQVAAAEYHTYVHRVGVLYMWDGNKCDFSEMHIAYQSKENGEMIYLGKLDFPDGENMDLETTIGRIAFSMLECLL